MNLRKEPKDYKSPGLLMKRLEQSSQGVQRITLADEDQNAQLVISDEGMFSVRSMDKTLRKPRSIRSGWVAAAAIGRNSRKGRRQSHGSVQQV
jgi:hypothetical protein